MNENENIVTNGMKNKRTILEIQSNRLLNCNVCGKQIDQLFKSEYLCRGCYNVRHKTYNARYREKIKEIYDGYYLYMIIDAKTKEPVYIGYSTNIFKRHYEHFNTSYNTTFSTYITDNKLDNSLFEMKVLDLSAYRDSITIDDVLLLEHFIIANNSLKYDILNEKGLEFNFSEEATARIKYLCSLIDLANFIEYEEIIHKKNTIKSNNDSIS